MVMVRSLKKQNPPDSPRGGDVTKESMVNVWCTEYVTHNNS